MADQNQGASIEAEREVIERAIWFLESGLHTIIARDTMANELRKLLARRTPAAAPGAGELPPLPKPDVRSHLDVGSGFGASAYSLALVEQIRREAIAHYQRKQAALQEIIDIRQEIEAGAAPNVKTWQERANELAVSGRPRGYPDTDELEALKDAEIADLRAQLAAKGQGFEQWWADQIKANGDVPIGADYRHCAEKGYLAAPASAQPADPRLEAFIDWYLREGKRSEIHPNGHIERTTREHVLAWLDQATGAQPDQRESAAVPDEVLKVGGRMASWLHGLSRAALPFQSWACKCKELALDWDQVAAAPSPAAQPVAKEGDQPTKGENA
jgi:hypothetical protein